MTAAPEQAVQAGTLSATHAGHDADPMMALDSMVFEWTATATYLMSYVDRPGHGHDVMALNLARADSNTIDHALPKAAVSMSDLQAAIGRRSGVLGPHAGVTGLSATSIAHADPDAEQPLRESSSASLGALAEWMSRSMKHITGADGRSTWWVRDYQLSGAHVPALLDALLQSGQALPDRIMLNGALVWQRSSLSQGVNNGD
ncbi:hypothetical protein HG421_20080 [Xanthomonas campestris pv. badrii]|uniref:Uncharacterized protein n=2 Tax=Xanthomonas campestris TaxID=339 RepID=A0A7Z2ZJB5_XANCA|nr:hypothetical protein HG421_20080 [Xanthomonas campestris pv. badrii]